MARRPLSDLQMPQSIIRQVVAGNTAKQVHKSCDVGSSGRLYSAVFLPGRVGIEFEPATAEGIGCRVVRLHQGQTRHHGCIARGDVLLSVDDIDLTTISFNAAMEILQSRQEQERKLLFRSQHISISVTSPLFKPVYSPESSPTKREQLDVEEEDLSKNSSFFAETTEATQEEERDYQIQDELGTAMAAWETKESLGRSLQAMSCERIAILQERQQLKDENRVLKDDLGRHCSRMSELEVSLDLATAERRAIDVEMRRLKEYAAATETAKNEAEVALSSAVLRHQNAMEALCQRAQHDIERRDADAASQCSQLRKTIAGKEAVWNKRIKEAEDRAAVIEREYKELQIVLADVRRVQWEAQQAVESQKIESDERCKAAKSEGAVQGAADLTRCLCDAVTQVDSSFVMTDHGDLAERAIEVLLFHSKSAADFKHQLDKSQHKVAELVERGEADLRRITEKQVQPLVKRVAELESQLRVARTVVKDFEENVAAITVRMSAAQAQHEAQIESMREILDTCEQQVRDAQSGKVAAEVKAENAMRIALDVCEKKVKEAQAAKMSADVNAENARKVAASANTRAEKAEKERATAEAIALKSERSVAQAQQREKDIERRLQESFLLIAELEKKAAAASTLAELLEQKKGFTQRLLDRADSARSQQAKLSEDLARAQSQSVEMKAKLSRELEQAQTECVAMKTALHAAKEREKSLAAQKDVTIAEMASQIDQLRQQLTAREQVDEPLELRLTAAENERQAALDRLTQRDAEMMQLVSRYQATARELEAVKQATLMQGQSAASVTHGPRCDESTEDFSLLQDTSLLLGEAIDRSDDDQADTSFWLLSEDSTQE